MHLQFYKISIALGIIGITTFMGYYIANTQIKQKDDKATFQTRSDIIGGVVGGVVGIMSVGALYYLLYRNRDHTLNKSRIFSRANLDTMKDYGVIQNMNLVM